MGLIALDIPVGIFRTGTDYQSKGRYYAADLWRFHSGKSGPIGGWASRTTVAMTGKARAIIAWLSNSGQAWTGVGTHTKLYAVSRSGAVSDITPLAFTSNGRADAVMGAGYGEGLYSASTYGTARTSATSIIPASVWSLDTWGEYLVGTIGESIYEWRLVTSTRAAAITNAPQAEAILVTDERIMMALGSGGDPRAVDWSTNEDNTIWTPSATNQAGGKRLQTNGAIKCGRRVKGANLLWTNVDVHRATYVGLPQVYAFELLETGCGTASKGAVALGAAGQAFWMGDNGFWVYNGFVQPLECDVFDYVFSDINRTQISKVTAWHNSLHGEIWWLYPSATSTEVDRYVYYKYLDGQQHWNFGTLTRLSGFDRGVLSLPQMVGNDGLVYYHESGNIKDGRSPTLTSGPVELGDGDRTVEVHAIIPDENALGGVAVSFSVADYPEDTPVTVAAVTSTSKTDVRFCARKVAVVMTGTADVDFGVGRFRFDVKPGSER